MALSGDPEDIYRTDAKVKELLPGNAHLHNWLDMARERIEFQGLPARICWVGLGDRHRLGLAFNDMVARGEVSAPIVIGRDHLDAGSVASPNRETEAMLDGSDAVSDWPLLNAMLNCASGATWVSLHHGGGVGIGYSQHAGMVVVCDGTPEAARRIERVLWNDPASGVMRHADAGYDTAIDCAREFAWTCQDCRSRASDAEDPSARLRWIVRAGRCEVGDQLLPIAWKPQPHDSDRRTRAPGLTIHHQARCAHRHIQQRCDLGVGWERRDLMLRDMPRQCDAAANCRVPACGNPPRRYQAPRRP